MRKVALALGSFLLGSVFGIHTSTLEHSEVSPVVTFGKAPVVEELSTPSIHDNEYSNISGRDIGLDGLNCQRCKFNDVSLTYGGGQYNCLDCTFSGVHEIHMHGAALNTVRFLEDVGKLSAAPTAPVAPNNPATMMVDFKQPAKLTWSALQK